MSRALLLAPLVLLAATPAEAQKSAIAVLDIQGTGIDPELLPTLTEILTVEIDSLGLYKVIAGRDVQAMLGFEKQKDVLGCTDAACLAEIGGALGVDRIVASHIGKVGSTFVVNIKLINIRMADTEGRVYETVKGETDALITTVKKSVVKLLGQSSKPAGGAPASEVKPAPAPPPAQVAPPPAAPPPVEEVEEVEEETTEEEPAPAVTAQAGGGRAVGTASWILWGAGGVVVVAGAVVGMSAKSAEKHANDPNFVGGQLERERAQNKARTANILFGVGALSAGAGLLLFLLSDAEPAPAVATITPLLSTDTIGLSFSGRF